MATRKHHPVRNDSSQSTIDDDVYAVFESLAVQKSKEDALVESRYAYTLYASNHSQAANKIVESHKKQPGYTHSIVGKNEVRSYYGSQSWRSAVFDTELID